MTQEQSNSHPVSVVIPTFNGLHLLKKNLPAVFLALRSGDEVVVVDDASTDDTVEWLEKSCPVPQDINVTVIRNKENKRFAATANSGVKKARHQLIFLLNNDVTPRPDVLRFLVPHFSDQKVFAVGCLEIEHHQQDMKSGKNQLWFEKGMFVHSRANDFKSGETGWASGGSALFDRTKWQILGGFDRAYYPAYWEDIDLSFRAKQHGWKVLFEPRAVVEHNHETTNQDIFGQAQIDKLSWRNAQVFVWKNGTLKQKFEWIIWRPYWWWQRLKIARFP